MSIYNNFFTHVEECDVVADEVVDDAGLLGRFAPSLEQARREDGRQFFTRHLVEVGALMDPKSGDKARSV